MILVTRVFRRGLSAGAGAGASARVGAGVGASARVGVGVAAAASGVRIAAHRDFLRVTTASDGAHYDFHWFWLRHLCPEVPHSRHPLTHERTLDAADVPLDLQPEGVAIDGDGTTVTVQWGPVPHAHASRYPVPWLLQHAYGRGHEEVAPPVSDPALVTVHYAQFARTAHGRSPPAYFDEVRARLHAHGAVVVRGRGFDTEDIMYVP
jgi:hypothetical protein